MPKALAIALGKDFFKNPKNLFAEGQGAALGKVFFKKKFKKNYFFAKGRPLVNNFFLKKKPLPRALAIALGKVFFGKNPENLFAEGQGGGPRQRFLKKKFFAEGRPSAKKIKKKPLLCRGSALGKETANGAGV